MGKKGNPGTFGWGASKEELLMLSMDMEEWRLSGYEEARHFVEAESVRRRGLGSSHDFDIVLDISIRGWRDGG